MQGRRFALLLAAAFAVCSAAASARANVVLKLEGDVVRHGPSGAEIVTPLGDAALTPGATVRYVLVATNAGSSVAGHLVPQAMIPAGTAYEPGSASTASALRVEFSLDGGKTWARKPLVKVPTPNGVVEKPAGPAAYTALRWISAKPLGPKSSLKYRYEVRVK